MTTAGGNQFYVFVVPVAAELALKKAAKVVVQKKIEMIAVKELLDLTGYVRGSCSPVGMKKLFPTYLDESAEGLDYMIVERRENWAALKLAPQALASACGGKFAEIV